VLFACVLSGFPVEVAYLAYLKSKDRGYWEIPPKLSAREKQQLWADRFRFTRKLLIKGGLIAAGVVLFFVWARWEGHE